MRELVFDTETTGLNQFEDRLIEIGVVELQNLIPTGQTFHRYINPLRDVNPGAFKVHGISNDFLRDKPYFHEIVDDLIDFIGDDQLVAHNADFDIRFINEELKRLKLPPLSNPVVDTLTLSRQIKRGGSHTLDAMCRYFNVDTTRRVKHGALLDSEILAEVYLGLRGGRQFGLGLLGGAMETRHAEQRAEKVASARPFTSLITQTERDAHSALVAGMSNSIWAKYQSQDEVAA